MFNIERTITIHRPMGEVFAYLSDVEHGPQYISGQREAHKTSAGPMGIGTIFASTGKFLRRSATSTVTEYEPDRRLAWKETSGARATTAWSFEPSDAPGLLGLAEPLMERLASGQIDHDLSALKELLAVARKPASMAKGW
jgi:uncharacterized membrane protein